MEDYRKAHLQACAIVGAATDGSLKVLKKPPNPVDIVPLLVD
jgi:hypothetical protein